MDLGGSFLSPNVRESQQAAAERWGATYTAFTEPWGPCGRYGHFAAKLDLDLLPLAHPCRVCWLDGDVVIRDTCPSLFDLVEPGTFGGVLNSQGDTHGDNPHATHWPSWCEVSHRMEHPIPYRPETYINGGVLVFDLPRHGVVWARVRECGYGATAVQPMIEQTAMNIGIAQSGSPLTILPHTYGKLGAVPWAGGAMTEEVYHLAQLGPLRGRARRREILETVQWRTG